MIIDQQTPQSGKKLPQNFLVTMTGAVVHRGPSITTSRGEPSPDPGHRRQDEDGGSGSGGEGPEGLLESVRGVGAHPSHPPHLIITGGMHEPGDNHAFSHGLGPD